MNREQKSLERKAGTVNGDPGMGPWGGLTALLRDLRAAGSSECPLEPLARFAVSELGAGHALVLDQEAGGEKLRSLGAAGLETAPERGKVLALARELAAWVQKTRLPVAVTRPERDERFEDPPSHVVEAVALPLGWGDDARGALVVFYAGAGAGDESGPERDESLAFLSLFAALILDRRHSRLLCGDLSRRAEESERLRLRAESIASMGELVAEMSREVKEPMASLGGLASQIAESMEEGDPRRPLLDILVREVERLDRVLSDQLELARTPLPELGPDDLNRLLEECLMLLGPELESSGARVTKRLGCDIPLLLLDTNLMRRVFLNMLRTGLERSRSGGKIRIESKRKGTMVEVQIAALGSRAPGDVVELLWRPFQVDRSRPGDITSRGVERILKEHQGTLQVSSNREWAIIFTLALPIPGNRERRRGGERRRRSRRTA
jgi:signal transduction histidine kinase